MFGRRCEAPLGVDGERPPDVLSSRRGPPLHAALPSLAFEEWTSIGFHLGRIRDITAWGLGDWSVAGAILYGERHAQGFAATGRSEVTLSVKAGKTGSAHVDQLRGVVDKEDAAIGALITFQEPTKPMRENVASAGQYVSPGWNQPYPRIQLLTVGGLLSGKARLRYPHVTGETFKKAPKVSGVHPDSETLPGLE